MLDLDIRVALSVSTSRSRDGLETHLWSRLVSSRPFLATSRSRLGLGNLGLESRLGLVAYRLGLWTSRLGLVEWKLRKPSMFRLNDSQILTLFERALHSYSFSPRAKSDRFSLCNLTGIDSHCYFIFSNSVSAFYCIYIYMQNLCDFTLYVYRQTSVTVGIV